MLPLHSSSFQDHQRVRHKGHKCRNFHDKQRGPHTGKHDQEVSCLWNIIIIIHFNPKTNLPPSQPTPQGPERALCRLQTAPSPGAQVRAANPNHRRVLAAGRLHPRHHRPDVRAVAVRGALPGGDQGEEGGRRLEF